jgi:hypothetical protein
MSIVGFIGVRGRGEEREGVVHWEAFRGAGMLSGSETRILFMDLIMVEADTGELFNVGGGDC